MEVLGLDRQLQIIHLQIISIPLVAVLSELRCQRKETGDRGRRLTESDAHRAPLCHATSKNPNRGLRDMFLLELSRQMHRTFSGI